MLARCRATKTSDPKRVKFDIAMIITTFTISLATVSMELMGIFWVHVFEPISNIDYNTICMSHDYNFYDIWSAVLDMSYVFLLYV